MAVCEVLGALLVGGAPLASSKQRRLLAALTIAHGGVVSSDRLGDVVWGGEPPDSNNALQTYVSRLRTTLGAGSVVRRPPGYALVLPVDAVDAWRFEWLVDEARRRPSGEALDVLDEALGLWRGPAYAEFADDEFARAEAVRLEELRASAAVARLDALLQLGRPAEAAADAVRLIEADPYREPVWERRMRALHASGRTVDAVRAYRQYRTLLADETGLQPSADLAALERALLADPSMSEPFDDALPFTLTSFVGREDVRDAIVELLAAERVVTLVGPGGVGKTRLAIEVGSAYRGCIASRVSFVELAAISADGLTSAVARTLGLGGSPDPFDTLRRALVDHLLVLDNCEHVAASAAALVETLVRACSTVRVLSTSRIRLGVSGERVWSVPPLPVPDPRRVEGLADLDRHAATRMFLDRAVAAGVEIDDRAPPARAIAGICAAVDGLPLGIELAAALTRDLPLERIAVGLGDHRQSTSADRTAFRHRSLEATIGWSHALLDARGQQLFRRLAVFDGGWTIEAAEVVCAGNDLDPVDIAAALADLAGASLVTFVPTTGRYSMLETVHAFARARLSDAGETTRIHDAHLGWCQQLARTTGPKILGSSTATQVRQLDIEHSNLLTAIRWALAEARHTGAAARLAHDLLVYWHTVGAGRDVAVLLDQVLGGPAPPTVERVELHLGAGAARVVVGDFRAGTAHYHRALDLCRRLEAPRLLARCLLSASGDPDSHHAIANVAEAELIAERLGDRQLALRAIRMLGSFAQRAGRYDEAIGRYEQVILNATGSDNALQARYLLAHIHQAQGRYQEARDQFLVVEQGAGESGSWSLAADACVQLTLVELAAHDLDRARLAHERSAVWGCADHPAEQLEFDAVGALLRSERGDSAGAAAIGHRLAALSPDLGERPAVGRGWLVTGEVLARAGDKALALRCFGRLLRHRSAKSPDFRAHALAAISGTLDTPAQQADATVLAATAEAIRARHHLVIPSWLTIANKQTASSDTPVPPSRTETAAAVALALTYQSD